MKKSVGFDIEFSKLAIKQREVRRKKLLPFYRKQLAQAFQKPESEIDVLGVEETLAIVCINRIRKEALSQAPVYEELWKQEEQQRLKIFLSSLGKDVHRQLMFLHTKGFLDCGWVIISLNDIFKNPLGLSFIGLDFHASSLDRSFGLQILLEETQGSKDAVSVRLWGGFWNQHL